MKLFIIEHQIICSSEYLDVHVFLLSGLIIKISLNIGHHNLCLLATVLITKDTSAYIPLAGFILQNMLFLMKQSFLTTLCFKLNQRNQATLPQVIHHLAGQCHSHTIHNPTYLQVRPLIPFTQALKIMFPLLSYHQFCLHMILTKPHLIMYLNPLCHLLVYLNPLCHLPYPHTTCFLMIMTTLLLYLLPP